MNIRVLLLIMLVLVFAVGLGSLSFISGSTLNLEKAQADGKATITQNTPAGTVPHTVTVFNNNSNSIKADKGQVLTSTSSQDLVLAEEKIIPAGANQTIRAYCTEPREKANPGTQLKANQSVSPEIIKIIDTSNPADSTNAQLQIWTIVSGGNVDPYSGEAAALVQTQQITYTKLKDQLSSAKSQVLTNFNLTDQSLQNIKNATNSSSNVKTALDNFSNWISSLLGLK